VEEAKDEGGRTRNKSEKELNENEIIVNIKKRRARTEDQG
jgi:hypothetical protein